jgi:hypothetical protein
MSPFIEIASHLPNATMAPCHIPGNPPLVLLDCHTPYAYFSLRRTFLRRSFDVPPNRLNDQSLLKQSRDMDDSFTSDLASLFLAFQNESSQACAETQIEAFLQADRSKFVIGCAVVIQQADTALLVSAAFLVFQRAMAPNADCPMAAIRRAWGTQFSEQGRDLIKDAVFGGMKHADPSVRQSAIGPITLLFLIARENSPNILSELQALICNQDDDSHFAEIALQTLCAIYNSGVICELPAHLTLAPLREQIDFFITSSALPRISHLSSSKTCCSPWRP